MINEDYVSFETAKLLKDKGFNENCSRSYVKDKLTVSQGFNNSYYKTMYSDEYYRPISAPTLQMAMKWLREVHHIPIEILWHYDSNSDIEEWYFVHHVELKILPNNIEYYETYEEACEASIKYCLENLI